MNGFLPNQNSPQNENTSYFWGEVEGGGSDFSVFPVAFIIQLANKPKNRTDILRKQDRK